MKYCVKCGNSIEDDMMFCQKCGTKCAPVDSVEMDTANPNLYGAYWGLSFSDAYKKTIELTPDGVHVFRTEGIYPTFDKTIPYDQIVDVHFKWASALGAGYISVITATDGLQIEYAMPSVKQAKALAYDENTVIFQKTSQPATERIYRALKDISYTPSTSAAYTTNNNSVFGKQENSQIPTSLSPPKPKKRRGCLILTMILVALIIIGIVIPKPENKKNPEDYSDDVFTAFWEEASDSFGVEYGDYKMIHTATSYICDYETSDGYTAHYYLINTAFESKNAFGQDALHDVTARCYYVPDFSNTVYSTYLTLDGEAIFYDEEKENWLMDMG